MLFIRFIMQSKQICFCGSKLPFDQCCQPLIHKIKRAQTPEQLMRSRFSAYAIKAYQYIFDTYAKQSQSELSVEDIQQSGEDSHWFALVIYSKEVLDNQEEQFVEFSAYYIVDDNVYEMREKSRFMLENNKQWRYIDGEIIKHSLLEKIARKQLCPCNKYPTAWPSAIEKKKGKKYKQCCGK